MNKDDLRRKSREAIQAGKLPNRKPDRTWGGHGAGDRCAICDCAVKADELEFELEFVRESQVSDSYHFHLHCYEIWDLERQKLPDTVASNGEQLLPTYTDSGNIAGREVGGTER
jgi:hypothetical protein